MSSSGLVIVASGALLLISVGRWVASPWFVPDLMLVGLVVAMSHASEQSSITPAVLGSLVAMLTSTSHAVVIGGAYLVVGAVLNVLAGRVDLANPFIQLIVLGAAEGCLLVLWVVLSLSLMTMPYFGATLSAWIPLLAGKWLLTLGCFLLVKRLQPKRDWRVWLQG